MEVCHLSLQHLDFDVHIVCEERLEEIPFGLSQEILKLCGDIGAFREDGIACLPDPQSLRDGIFSTQVCRNSLWEETL